MKSEIESIVDKYLKKVKEKLPEWLKEDKNEVEDILIELEDHLWAKAKDLSDIGQPTVESMRIAVAHMGSPSSIARGYKQRGTPHVYISKELWPYYKKVLMIVFAIIGALELFSFIVNLIIGNWEEAFNIIGYYTAFSSAFLIISVIFVALSMEGFFPEDFISKAERERKENELMKAEEMGLPVSPDTGKQLKPFVKPIEKFVGGGFGMVFALILIIQPVPGFFTLMNPEFRSYLVLIGMLFLVDSITSFIRGFLGNTHVSAHQFIQVITIITKVAAGIILLLLSTAPKIFPVIYLDETGIIVSEIAPEFIGLYEISMRLLGFIDFATIGANIYETYKLQKYKIPFFLY